MCDSFKKFWISYENFLGETESGLRVYTVGDLDSGSILLSVKALKTHQDK